jgi:ABC-type branched-subunit amino acid transport system ATPase component
MSNVQLAINNVWAGYQDGIDVLKGVSLATRQNGMTVLIGPNGAGKSTLLRTIFGFLHPHRGSIKFGTQDISTLAPHEIKSAGVSYIAQGINVFPQLTVEENLRMGAWTIRKDKKRLNDQFNRVYELFPVLRERRLSRSNELSGGQAKMLSTAKEVMTNPALILVDEPTAGLAPAFSEQVYDFLLQTQRALGCAILLVDQNIEAAVQIADYVYLMNLGRIRNEGPQAQFPLPRVRELIQECLVG